MAVVVTSSGDIGPPAAAAAVRTLRHNEAAEHAHLLSNIMIEKLALPIWGRMFPFWSPAFEPEINLARQLELEPTST